VSVLLITSLVAFVPPSLDWSLNQDKMPLLLLFVVFWRGSRSAQLLRYLAKVLETERT
jgi:hypothetical protein